MASIFDGFRTVRFIGMNSGKTVYEVRYALLVLIPRIGERVATPATAMRMVHDVQYDYATHTIEIFLLDC